jgi:hypothetical protein
MLPHIISPVLAEQADGKIAPHNLLWPSYWAILQADTLTPLNPEVISPLISKIIVNDDSSGTGNWLNLNDSLMVRVLDTLRMSQTFGGEAVYIGGGKMFHRDLQGGIIAQNHRAAAPYLWPLAHDVRPAARALGVRGCSDCHALKSPFYFGRVEIDKPLQLSGRPYRRMIDFSSQTRIQAVIFSFSFLFRPWLKLIIIITVLIISAVVLVYGFKGLSAVLVKFTADQE